MLLGHYGFALAAKRAAPRTSLGAATVAAQWLDELWPLLLLAGVERVRIAPGLTAASPLEFTHYPYSHGLLAAVGWGALVAVAYVVWRRSARGALVVGALVVSHWPLDLLVHRPDLPLWPGSTVRAGLGLWHSLVATVTVELTVFLAGLAVYVRETRPRDGAGRWGLVAMVALLLVVFVGGLAGDPPPDARSLAVFALGLWLFVPLGWWVDRHRAPRRPAVGSP